MEERVRSERVEREREGERERERESNFSIIGTFHSKLDQSFQLVSYIIKVYSGESLCFEGGNFSEENSLTFPLCNTYKFLD